uniref:Mei2-like C-terminal RNA recognition motif domain-containing protein n=1 Tax=Zooxanthella nutricula TaxID=1333877 RepID=A0A7S2PIT3_9DINO
MAMSANAAPAASAPNVTLPNLRMGRLGGVRVTVKNTFLHLGTSTPASKPVLARSSSMPTPRSLDDAEVSCVERRGARNNTHVWFPRFGEVEELPQQSDRSPPRGDGNKADFVGLARPNSAGVGTGRRSASCVSASDGGRQSSAENSPEPTADSPTRPGSRAVRGDTWRDCCGTEEASDGSVEDSVANGRTTLMLRSLPEGLSRQLLEASFDEQGFAALYDFVYLPTEISTGVAYQYCFVNLVSEGAAEIFFEHFQGFTSWPVACDKGTGVHWSSALQGLDMLIQRYRNSPIMHPCVPDKVKPALYLNGARIAFPKPTSSVPAPRRRRGIVRKNKALNRA